jgi:hypothetical protein
MNIVRHLERSAFCPPDRPAIRAESREITYRELHKKSEQVAAARRPLGMPSGDRTGPCAPKSPEWLAFYFGLLKVGPAAVTFSAQLPPEELTETAAIPLYWRHHRQSQGRTTTHRIPPRAFDGTTEKIGAFCMKRPVSTQDRSLLNARGQSRCASRPSPDNDRSPIGLRAGKNV